MSCPNKHEPPSLAFLIFLSVVLVILGIFSLPVAWAGLSMLGSPGGSNTWSYLGQAGLLVAAPFFMVGALAAGWIAFGARERALAMKIMVFVPLTWLAAVIAIPSL